MEIVQDLKRLGELAAIASETVQRDLDHLQKGRLANERDRRDIDARLAKLSSEEAEHANAARRLAEEREALRLEKDAFTASKVDYGRQRTVAEDAQRTARELQKLADTAKALNEDATKALKDRTARLDAREQDLDKREREIIVREKGAK